MKVVIVILCDDGLYNNGLKTINSLKFYHPEFKIIKLGTKELNSLKEKHKINDILFLGPVACKEIWEKENPDLLVKMGADCLVLGKLQHILNWEYDIVAPRNDSFYMFHQDESSNRPDLIRNIHHEYWMNADTVCIKSKKFLDDWYNLTIRYSNKELYSIANKKWSDDQHSMNIIAWTGGFNCKVLDNLENKSYAYGATANWNNEQSFANNLTESIKENKVDNSWPAWKSIFLKENGDSVLSENGLGFGERIIKILHHGCGTMKNKLSWDLFNPEYRKHLKKITGFDE